MKPSNSRSASADALFETERAAEIAEMLRALGHPLRLQIIALLCQEEMNVNALAERLGAAQPIVSQQLRILRMSGLVEVSRAGGFARYRIARPHLPSLIRCMHKCCDH